MAKTKMTRALCVNLKRMGAQIEKNYALAKKELLGPRSSARLKKGNAYLSKAILRSYVMVGKWPQKVAGAKLVKQLAPGIETHARDLYHAAEKHPKPYMDLTKARAAELVKLPIQILVSMVDHACKKKKR